LEEKTWYRFSKVVYIVFYCLALFYLGHRSYRAMPTMCLKIGPGLPYVPCGSWLDFSQVLLVGLAVVVIAGEVIRRMFFYVITGRAFFEKSL
jgi:hypothetical protein